MSFVIRYTDGAYNFNNGFPARIAEATHYETKAEAEQFAVENLFGVDCILSYEDACEIGDIFTETSYD